MFEKNETDFYISYDKKRNEFSLSIGTWSNSGQSFADVIFYLTLEEKYKQNFYKELNKYNDLFIKNKNNIIKDIKKNELNLLNSCFNENEINNYIDIYEGEERRGGFLGDNEYYSFNFKSFDFEIEQEFKIKIINIIKNSKNIINVYEKLQDLKKEMQEFFCSNFFNFVKQKGY